MTPITFLINVKNEEPRIDYILSVATRWADEVIVVDKGSTDNTVRMARNYPTATIIVDPSHGRAGDEDRINWVNYCKHDWIYVGTPSEIPTHKLIEKCREMVDGDFDLITVPRKMYMLGVHSPNSPWYISNYKFLINRTRTAISNKIHNNFMAMYGKEGHIQYSEDCCVHHLTYTSGKHWLETMIDYWQLEAEGSTDPAADIAKAFGYINRHDAKLKAGGDELFMMWLAWNMYHLGTAFCLEEKRRGMDIVAEYKKVYDRVMEEWNV